MDTKEAIRRAFAAARDKIGPEALAIAGEKAASHLDTFLGAHANIRMAACYASRRSELPTGPTICALRGKSVKVAMPMWDGATYRFATWDSGAPLAKGPMSIPQPANGAVLDADQIDLFLVPGIAFDMHGGRIGYGGGWYDRLLAGRRSDSLVLGFCLDTQVSDEPLPREPHDAMLDGILTPSGLFSWGKYGN